MSEKLLSATHQGELSINKIKIKSYVLDDGVRVLNRIEFLRALGRTGKAKGGRKYDRDFKVPIFLSANNLKSYINKDLLENSTPIKFKDLNGNLSIGYKAELLASVCSVFLEANDAGDVILKNQEHIVERCKILIRGFATVGIIALVDEATGYQEVRDRLALQKILEMYIAKELRPWVKTFPDDFYEHLFRLKDWQYKPVSVKRPQIVGKITNDIIYERLERGVLDELKNKTPRDQKGRRKHQFHRLLTEDIGNPKLREHISNVVTLMKASASYNNFYRLLQRALPKKGHTIEMALDDDE